MKILVLGHKGMPGRDLMLGLSVGHEVEGKDMEDFDIADPKDCARMVEEYAPELIVNALAYGDVASGQKDRDRCFAVNAVAVKHLALACRERGIPLVHISSAEVFDGRKGSPYAEEDEPAPLGVYGASRLEGERFLQAFAEPYLLIRTGWLFGRHGGNFVRDILEQAENAKELEAAEDRIGSPTFSRDLAAAVRVLIEGGHRGIFHVANRGRCSLYELACKTLHYSGRCDVTVRPIRSSEEPGAALHGAWSVLSGRKFFAQTGKTLPHWQIALQDYLEHAGYRR